MTPLDLKNTFGTEDIALAIVILGVISVIWFMQGGDTGSYTPTAFCEQAAIESQANLSARFGQASCECVSPRNIRQPSTPQEVDNVTDYRDVLVCDVEQLDRQLIFPLLHINETKYDQYNQSRLNDTQIIQDGQRRTIPG